MAAGDVTVEIAANSSTAIKAIMESLYVSANDKWAMTPIANGQQVLIMHVEEA